MGIDERHQPKPIGHRLQGSDVSMLVGAERELRRRIGQEPIEELVRRAEMEQGDRPRFAIDAAGLHNAVVSVSPSFDFLDACHGLCIQQAKNRVKPFKILDASGSVLCIHFSSRIEGA
jgi:hypothetical protein